MKKLIVTSVILLLFLSGFSQVKFNPDSGLIDENSNLKNLNFHEFSGFSYEVMAGVFIPQNLLFYSFGFFPRYNFMAPKNWISLSVGSPINAGFDFGSNGVTTVFLYMIDIPLTLDLNIGARATSFNESIFGAFLGAGLDYNFMHISVNSEKASINTFGPMMHGGMRWTMNGRPSGVRLSFLNGLSFNNVPGQKIFSFTFVYGI